MGDIVRELTELNTAFAQAEFLASVEFFRHHLADGLRFRRASGKVVDKITFLKDLATPGNTNERLEARQIEVLAFGSISPSARWSLTSKVCAPVRVQKGSFATPACLSEAKGRGSARSGSTRRNPDHGSE